MKNFKNRDSATAALRKIGVKRGDYNSYISIDEELDVFVVDLDRAKADMTKAPSDDYKTFPTFEDAQAFLTERGVAEDLHDLVILISSDYGKYAITKELLQTQNVELDWDNDWATLEAEKPAPKAKAEKPKKAPTAKAKKAPKRRARKAKPKKAEPKQAKPKLERPDMDDNEGWIAYWSKGKDTQAKLIRVGIMRGQTNKEIIDDLFAQFPHIDEDNALHVSWYRSKLKRDGYNVPTPSA